MIIIALNHPQQYDFLLKVIDAYTRNGMAAAELPVASDTYVAVANAQTLDPQPKQHLGKTTVASIGPSGIALDVHPPKTVPESPEVYEQ